MDSRTEACTGQEPVIIKTQALTRKYGKISAVDSLDLEVKEGEIFGLLGPNGAGKTTLISMLCTMLKPTSGRAWVNGFDIVKEPGKVRKSIGIVFQAPSVDDLLTGRENLSMHDLVNTYSGGMRRRLELAQKECMTVMLTTHYMEEAESLCDRVAIIDYGKIVALDSPAQLKDHIVGDGVTLKPHTFDMEKLRKLEYVRKIEEKDGLLYLSIKDASKHLQDLLTHTGPIDFVEVRSGTLNDVFMHYTGREIREGEGEGGFWERMMKK